MYLSRTMMSPAMTNSKLQMAINAAIVDRLLPSMGCCCPLFLTASIILHVLRSVDAGAPEVDLLCNFDNGNLCKWRSDTDLWMIGVNVPINSSQFIPHSTGSGGTAVLAEGHLISPEVEESDERGAVLSFCYWKSNNLSKLDVCIAQRDIFVCAYTAPDAADGGEPQWITQMIVLPKNLSIPFKVVFRARNIHAPSDIVAVDDIQYTVDSSKASSASPISDVSIDELPKMILTSKQTVSASCFPVRCTFVDSPCAWSLETPWQRLEGNLALDSEAESVAKSDHFLVPVGAFFELDVWMSDDAVLTILEQRNGNGENESVIWTRKGLYGADGWHRLRVPVSSSDQPIRLLLKGNVPANNFITVSNTKLVNNDGNEIGCGIIGMEPIKPRASDPERLTAYQKLHIDQEKPTIFPSDTEFPATVRPLLNNAIAADPFNHQTSSTVSSIGARSTIISGLETNGIQYPSTPSNAKTEELSRIRPGFSPEIADPEDISLSYVSPQREHTPSPYIPLAPPKQQNVGSERRPSVAFTRLNRNKPSAEQSAISQHWKPGVTPRNNDTIRQLSALLSQIGGQPVLEMQLRQLAQRLRFTQIDAEQALKLLKNLLNSKGRLQPVSAKLLSTGTNYPGQPYGQPEPIRPVNAPEAQLSSPSAQLNSLLSLLPVELRSKFTGGVKGLLGENLNDEIVKRLGAVLSPPRTNIDAQLPLTRNNLDFIVQNANSAAAAAAAAVPSIY